MNESLLFWLGVMIVSAGMVLVKVIRARVIAGRAGILKVCVNWVPLVIQLVACVIFVIFGVNRYSQAEKQLRAARNAETIAGRLDGVTGGGNYQQASIKPETLVPSANANSLWDTAEKLRANSKALKAFSFFCFTLAGSELLFLTTSFWYVTNAGVVQVNFKIPEPFYAVLNGNKIDINYTARMANIKKVKSFKATPKNMEIFGRFLVQGYPQYPQNPQYFGYSQQNIPYPQNTQFPQNPQDPQNPNNTL